jgi:hypothetical protein
MRTIVTNGRCGRFGWLVSAVAGDWGLATIAVNRTTRRRKVHKVIKQIREEWGVFT